MDQFIKHYSNREITVVWQPDLCIHSGNCARGLPLVFDPRRRPWIDASAATTEEIVNQVAKCPSGALSIKRTDSGPTEVGPYRSTAESQSDRPE